VRDEPSRELNDKDSVKRKTVWLSRSRDDGLGGFRCWWLDALSVQPDRDPHKVFTFRPSLGRITASASNLGHVMHERVNHEVICMDNIKQLWCVYVGLGVLLANYRQRASLTSVRVLVLVNANMILKGKQGRH
jgi:hypothetical protein